MRKTLLILYFTLPLLCFAQTIERIDRSDGLPSNTVYYLHQSHDHYVWMATDMGLIRYDGQKAKVYNQDDGLLDNENFEIFEPQKNKLTLAGSGGHLSSMMTNGDKWNPPFKKEMIFEKFISEFIVLNDDRVIVASFGNGVKIFQEGKSRHLTVEEGLPDNYVSYVWESDQGVFLFSRNGISRLNKDDQLTIVYRFKSTLHFARAVDISHSELLFVGNDHFYRFTSSGNLKEVKGSKQLTTLAVNRIQHVDGLLFVSTYEGLFLSKIQNDSLVVQRPILRGMPVSSMLIDHEGNLWVASLTKGVFRITDWRAKSLTSELPIYSLYKSRDSTIYFGSEPNLYGRVNGGKVDLFQLKKRNVFSSQKITAIGEYNEAMWFRLSGGSALVENGQTTHYRSGSAVYSLFEGDLYIGTPFGLFRMPPDSLSILVLRDTKELIDEHAEMVLNEGVNCLIQKDGKLLVGSDKGLFEIVKGNWSAVKSKYHGPVVDFSKFENSLAIVYQYGGVIVWNEKDTLHLKNNNEIHSDECFSIEIDKDYILVGTNDGLNIYSRKANGLDSAAVKVLFRNHRINDIEVSSGQVYFGTYNGLYSIDKKYLGRSIHEIPLQINKSYLQGHEVDSEKLSQLAYYENSLSFDLNYIYFGDEPVIKEYRLNKGQWQPFEGKLLFNELKPGTYDLEMRVRVGGMQSKIVQKSFAIFPPWWKTWWFRISAVLAFVLLIYWFFKVRILTYNRDIVREMLQLLLNRLKKEKFVVVKNVSDGSKSKIILSKLNYIESSKNYVTLYMTDHKVTVRSTMKEMYVLVSNESSNFFRCHRSFIVNVNKVSAKHGEFLKVGGYKIPIGTNYQEKTKAKFKDLK